MRLTASLTYSVQRPESLKLRRQNRASISTTRFPSYPARGDYTLPKQQLPIRYFAGLTRNIVNTAAQWMTTFVALWQPLRKGLQSLTWPPELARVSPAKSVRILVEFTLVVDRNPPWAAL